MLQLKNIIGIISHSPRTLFILCGFPYAGKSYVASQLLEQTDAVFVSIDNIFHEYGFDWNTNKLPSSDEWHRIFEESYDQTRAALKEGKSVLYDSTNHTVASRNKLREVAESVGAGTKVIYVKSSKEKIWERWRENQKNPSRSVVSRGLVQATIDLFEEPTEDEDTITVNNF